MPLARRELLGAALCAPMTALARDEPALSEVDRYPYVLGTQTIGQSYGFTRKPRLLETAEAIRRMGANTIKFAMGASSFGYTGGFRNVPNRDGSIRTLEDLAAREPTHRAVLDMPFAHTQLWVYPFGSGPLNASRQEYEEIYHLTRHLLRTYSGTGRRFYLGHWEGDWTLLGHTDPTRDPDENAIRRMIAWINLRGQAIRDARTDEPHHHVEVLHYIEVNLVEKAMRGRPTVTNSVLPHTPVDYVSYSCYDRQQGDLAAALDYVEARVPGAAVPGARRTFVGEYGFPAESHSPEQQDAQARRVLRTALEWGCPFALYWAFYCNEQRPDGTRRGFWMIDDKGRKQPIYETHRRYYREARAFVADFQRRHRRVPTRQEFTSQALRWLAEPTAKT